MALKNKVERKKKMKTREYSLFTAIAMIVGTVIGSGIFFKSDNVLIYTDGDVLKGVLVFTLAALGIIFGSLTIAVLASKTKNPGGLIAYADEFSGHKTGLCLWLVSDICILSFNNSCCCRYCRCLYFNAFWL